MFGLEIHLMEKRQRLFTAQVSAHIGVDLQDFLHAEVGQRAEVAGAVAVACGVADPVLGEVAGVRDAAVVALRDGVDRHHAQPRRERERRCPVDRELIADRVQDAVVRLLNVHDMVADAEVVHEHIARADVRLLAVRHEDADHAVHAQRLDAERRHDGAVLAAGDADDRVAVRPVLGKITADPFHAFGFDLLHVKHLRSLPINFHTVQF